MCFGTADSKGVTGTFFVSADSKEFRDKTSCPNKNASRDAGVLRFGRGITHSALYAGDHFLSRGRAQNVEPLLISHLFYLAFPTRAEFGGHF